MEVKAGAMSGLRSNGVSKSEGMKQTSCLSGKTALVGITTPIVYTTQRSAYVRPYGHHTLCVYDCRLAGTIYLNTHTLMFEKIELDLVYIIAAQTLMILLCV